MEYAVSPEGAVTVKETMSEIKAGSPDLFRFGVETALDGTLDAISFYGNGPHESYSDRHSSAPVGIYSQKVADQYWMGYARPQESGTHVGLRWFDVVDSAGEGLRFSVPEGTFSASALARRDVDLSVTGGGRREHGDQRHSPELRPDGLTHVNVDLVQMGLGCINSWGRLPRPEYRIPAAERSFTFTITPLVK